MWYMVTFTVRTLQVFEHNAVQKKKKRNSSPHVLTIPPFPRCQGKYQTVLWGPEKNVLILILHDYTLLVFQIQKKKVKFHKFQIVRLLGVHPQSSLSQQSSQGLSMSSRTTNGSKSSHSSSVRSLLLQPGLHVTSSSRGCVCATTHTTLIKEMQRTANAPQILHLSLLAFVSFFPPV